MNNTEPFIGNSLREEDGIDLSHYWRVLMRFKYGILALGVIIGAITAFVMNNKEDIYQSSATLLIEAGQTNITSIEGLYGIDNQRWEYFNTQSELLKNRSLAEKVISQMGLLQHPEFVPQTSPDDEARESAFNWKQIIKNLLSSFRGQDNSPVEISSEEAEYRLLEGVIAAFGGGLTIEQIIDTDLIRVHYEARDPVLAANIANTLANAYIENDMEQRMFANQRANLWLSERIQGLKLTLDSSEQALQDFMEAEQLIDIQGVGSLNIQELDALTDQSLVASRIKSEAETLYRQVQEIRNRPLQEIISFPVILNQSDIQRIKTNADDIARRRAELSERYGKNHPRMIALASEQDAVQQNLARQIQQVINSIENDYNSAVENEQTALTRLSQSKLDLQGVNRKGQELRQLQREVETNQQLYGMFFTRVRETDETDDFQSTNAVVVDPAVPALSPSKPQRQRMVVLGFAGGIMLGLALAFLRDMLENTIKNHEDVEDRLHTSMLGLVPLANLSRSQRETRQAYLGFIEDQHSSFSESFRTIRTGVTLSSLDKPYQVIEVTSSIPNEGKTTVAINMATVMGQMHRTLLIDTDMRRPTLGKSINLPSRQPGLSNLLAGTSSLEECLYDYEDANITVLLAGQISPNPLELISSQKFKDLLSALKESFDYIILDTPPTQAVSDALILGSFADAVIYVVKADDTSTKVIKTGLSRLQHANANIIGVVLNQVDISKQPSYYYGGYYDSYGYTGQQADSQNS